MSLARNTGPPTTEQMLFVQSIYERYRGLIYRIALERARDPTEADEIVSESLQRLFRNADTLRPLHEKQLVDYLADTLRSVAGDFERRQRTESRRLVSLESEFTPPHAADPETELVERESENALIRRLYETLDELSETDRRLLVGKYMQGASDEALARQLGVKAASIRMKLTRARNRARKIMERKEVGDSG